MNDDPFKSDLFPPLDRKSVADRRKEVLGGFRNCICDNGYVYKMPGGKEPCPFCGPRLKAKEQPDE